MVSARLGIVRAARGRGGIDVQRRPWDAAYPRVDGATALPLGEGMMNVAASNPSLDGARDAWEAAELEDAFWREHYGQYLEQYPDQFVAVSEGEVVATDSDLQQLMRILEAKRLDARRVWVRFMTTDPRRVMH